MVITGHSVDVFAVFIMPTLNSYRQRKKLSKIRNFGTFGISSSENFRKCVIQVENVILKNSLNKTGHPKVLIQ